MSMFFNINEGIEEDKVDIEFDMDSIEEEVMQFDDEVLGSLAIALHMETAYSKLTEAVGLMELSAIAAGEDPTQIYETSNIVTEGKAMDRIQSFFKAAKAFMIKWAGYIKGFFLKCFSMLESVYATNKQFLKDNETLLKNADIKDIEFKGFKYTIKELNNPASSVNLAKKAAKDANYSEENAEAQSINARRIICATSESDLMDSDANMRKFLYKRFRNNNTSPLTLSVTEAYDSVNNLISIIANSKSAKEKSKRDYENAKKTIKNGLQFLKDLEKDLKSNNSDNSNDKLITAASRANNTVKNILKSENAAHAEHIKALRSELLQARSVAGKIIFKGTKVKNGDFVKEDVAIEQLANLNFN